MKPVTKAYLQLHLAVLLYGFTAILGDLISLSAIVLVWWRVLIASISLFILIKFGRKIVQLPKKIIFTFMGIGILVGIHWITFFGAIKLSNASVCLVCMATTSFFTAFLEPAILKQKIKWYEIAIGIAIIPGMILVANSTELSSSSVFWGMLIGLLSAFLAATFATLNKKYVDEADPQTITFLELGSACLFISILLPFFFQQNPTASFFPVEYDWLYLIVLALLCTTFAYVISLDALRHISAFAANLTVNLEPVYGILLAIVILNEDEQLHPNFYLGCIVIIGAVLGYPFIKKRLNKSFK